MDKRFIIVKKDESGDWSYYWFCDGLLADKFSHISGKVVYDKSIYSINQLNILPNKPFIFAFRLVELVELNLV